MFTGIVEEKGKVRYIQLTGESGILAVKARKVLEGTRIGDSIAVNGVCLTVTSIRPDGFTADVMAETIRRSSLGSCKAGSQVNLERAMAADGRFGGHIVSGHIDGTGVIRSMLREENAIWVSIETSPQILHLIVEKGSVCIDGISLTVARVDEAGFQVSVIPHTGEETTLLEKVPGDLVNLENDVIGKYVEKLLGIRKNEEEKKESGITMAPPASFGPLFCLFALAKINISSQQKNIFPENFKNVFGEESKYYEINRTLISSSYSPVNVPSSLVHMPTFGVNLIGVALLVSVNVYRIFLPMPQLPVRLTTLVSFQEYSHALSFGAAV